MPNEQRRHTRYELIDFALIETPEGEPTALAFGAQVPFGPMLAIAAALAINVPANTCFLRC